MEYKLAAETLQVGRVEKATKRIQQTEWELTQYAERRMVERGITEVDARNAIAHGTIIEYHVKGDAKRWLLRATDGTCVVVDETTGAVVTVYYNDPSDHHATLNRQAYLFGRAFGGRA